MSEIQCSIGTADPWSYPKAYYPTEQEKRNAPYYFGVKPDDRGYLHLDIPQGLFPECRFIILRDKRQVRDVQEGDILVCKPPKRATTEWEFKFRAVMGYCPDKHNVLSWKLGKAIITTYESQSSSISIKAFPIHS